DVDVAITASQKCLMSSAGLSFVALSERAWVASRTARLPRSYFDFPATREALARPRPETPGTAPVHLFCQVSEAVSLIHEEGMRNTFSRHQEMACIVRKWACENGFAFVGSEQETRSPTLTAVRVPQGLKADEV